MASANQRSLQRIIILLGLLHVGLFSLYWSTNRSFYAEVNHFLFENLGKRWDYIQLALLLSAAVGLGCLLALFQLKAWEKRAGLGTWLVFGAVCLYLVFFYGSFWVLFSQSPGQWIRLVRLAGFYRFFLDAAVLIGAGILLKRVDAWITHRFQRRGQRLRLRSFCLVVYLLIWSVPLIIPPASVRRSTLPPKPLIIAHRGASMLAPENTLAAARKAADLGAGGLEVDIRISLDGTPFLMHDYGLERTTDVASVFPSRKEDLPESFTLAELKQLNAGEWFVYEDPYHTIAKGLVSPEEAQAMRKAQIPALAEVLDFLQGNEMVFIFDLLSPPKDHPYADRFFEIVFEMIRQAGMDSRLWFLVNGEQRQVVAGTGMVLTCGADYKDPPDAQTLVELGYQIVNVDYSLPIDWISRYQQAGLKVNLYVVDEPWMFSRLWLAGVDSITTNNVHTLMALEKPMLNIPYAAFLAVYCLIGILFL